ncbi:MAG: DUF115 domain-containing protein, partial [Simkaniaceae bacterium]|nr:DUF115 domain-containing protein [Simkaniaceae bacterium]
NLIVNYRRIPQGFFANRLKGQFEKIPAIICGGGPSLAEIKEHFHAIEDKALIFAGGSGIAALTHLGLLPHFALAVDPNSTEWDLVKNNGAFEVPILFASRVFPKIFASLNGPTGYVQTLSGGASERLIEEKLSLQGVELEEEVDLNGMSVTTLAIAYAIALGCYPIILCGVDLSYADDKLYAEGVLDEAMNAQAASATSGRSNGQVFLREGIDGRLVKTAVKWLMEADWIASKSAKQSKPIVNCSKKGLKIKGLHHIPLEKAIDRYLNKEYDLRGWVHTEIEVAQIGIEKNEIVDQVLEKLYTSLKQIEAKLCEMILLIQKEKRMDHPKLILFQMDMREEFAFQNLMQGIEPLVLNRIKRASNRLDFFASEETQKEYALDCEEKKYKLMQKIVLEYIKIYKVEYMGIL